MASVWEDIKREWDNATGGDPQNNRTSGGGQGRPNPAPPTTGGGGTSPSGGTLPDQNGGNTGNPYYSQPNPKPVMDAGKDVERLKNAPSGNISNLGGLSFDQVRGFMDEGLAQGEQMTGSTLDEVGQGRAGVRDRLQEILNGNSAGANALRQDQAQASKSLRAQQAVAGQGQMNAGQQQALKRQSSRDAASFVAQEENRALSNISKEFRGAGGDLMKSQGQFASVLVGSQPAAQTPSSAGGFWDVFSWG